MKRGECEEGEKELCWRSRREISLASEGALARKRLVCRLTPSRHVKGEEGTCHLHQHVCTGSDEQIVFTIESPHEKLLRQVQIRAVTSKSQSSGSSYISGNPAAVQISGMSKSNIVPPNGSKGEISL
jgi:hypothetical protein